MTTRPRIAVQLAGTALAAAGAASTMLGAWGAWSTGDAQDQTTQAGVLDLDFGAGSFSLALGTDGSPLVPGDSGCRVIAVINDGNVDFANARVRVEHSLSAPGYVDTPGNGSTGASDESQPGGPAAQAALLDSIEVTARYLDGGVGNDSGPAAVVSTAPDCATFATRYDAASGTPVAGRTEKGTALATVALRDIDGLVNSQVIGGQTVLDQGSAPGESTLVEFGDGAPGVFVSDGSSLAQRDVKFLEITYLYRADAPETTQNVFGSLTWVFTADQRAGITQ